VDGDCILNMSSSRRKGLLEILRYLIGRNELDWDRIGSHVEEFAHQGCSPQAKCSIRQTTDSRQMASLGKRPYCRPTEDSDWEWSEQRRLVAMSRLSITGPGSANLIAIAMAAGRCHSYRCTLFEDRDLAAIVMVAGGVMTGFRWTVKGSQ
jgi:hypothetical protein